MSGHENGGAGARGGGGLHARLLLLFSLVVRRADAPPRNFDKKTVLDVPLGGGTVQTLTSGRPAPGLGDIAVGPTYVYWVELAAKVTAIPK